MKKLFFFVMFFFFTGCNFPGRYQPAKCESELDGDYQCLLDTASGYTIYLKEGRQYSYKEAKAAREATLSKIEQSFKTLK